MKQFFIRVGVAVVLALGGVLTGYLLVSGERNQLRRDLDAHNVECDAKVDSVARELAEAERSIALRDAIVSLNRSQRDVAASNYGLANQHLDMARAKLAIAGQGALDSFADSMTTASNEVEEAKVLVNARDEGAVDALEEIIKSLEP